MAPFPCSLPTHTHRRRTGPSDSLWASCWASAPQPAAPTPPASSTLQPPQAAPASCHNLPTCPQHTSTRTTTTCTTCRCRCRGGARCTLAPPPRPSLATWRRRTWRGCSTGARCACGRSAGTQVGRGPGLGTGGGVAGVCVLWRGRPRRRDRVAAVLGGQPSSLCLACAVQKAAKLILRMILEVR